MLEAGKWRTVDLVRPGAPELRLLLDPRYYDRMYPGASPREFEFWSEEARQGGPILELGCGTGRIMVPLIEAAHEIDGLDICERMLSRVTQKLRVRGLGAKLLLGDLRSFTPPGPYQQAFCPFNTLAQLLSFDDLQMTVEKVARCLATGGRLVVELTNPDREVLAEQPDLWAEFEAPDDGGFVVVDNEVRFDAETRVLEHSFVYRYAKSGDRVAQTLRLRQHTKAEFDLAFAHAGFEIEGDYGDYDRSDRHEDSVNCIFVARLGNA